MAVVSSLQHLAIPPGMGSLLPVLFSWSSPGGRGIIPPSPLISQHTPWRGKEPCMIRIEREFVYSGAASLAATPRRGLRPQEPPHPQPAYRTRVSCGRAAAPRPRRLARRSQRPGSRCALRPGLRHPLYGGRHGRRRCKADGSRRSPRRHAQRSLTALAHGACRRSHGSSPGAASRPPHADPAQRRRAYRPPPSSRASSPPGAQRGECLHAPPALWRSHCRWVLHHFLSLRIGEVTQ